MGTPERNQIGTPVSKFEDSPVFNYINNLSPIKPVKSMHMAQTFNSLCFGSLPSVFTSPHVSFQKESRFLRRHQPLSSPKPQSSTESGNKVSPNKGAKDAILLCENAHESRENFDPENASGESPNKQRDKHSRLATELSETLNYDSGSPECNPVGIETDCAAELAGPSVSIVSLVQGSSIDDGSLKNEVSKDGTCLVEQTEEEARCEWQNLVSDPTDMLIFNSPNESKAFKEVIQKSADCGESSCLSPAPRFLQENYNNLQKEELIGHADCSKKLETGDLSTQPGEASMLKEVDLDHQNTGVDSLNECMTCNPSEKLDNKPCSHLHRGLRRRCLVFETVGNGNHTRRLDNGSRPSCSPSVLLESDENVVPHDKQLGPIKSGGDLSQCVLPGIGLHLNALAASSKDYRIVKRESFARGAYTILPSSTLLSHLTSTSQESLSEPFPLSEVNRVANGCQGAEDATQAPGYLASEEFNPSSPKKRRRKMENSEGEACKRCNCKKSKCLKLYCECFAAGVYCIDPCSCQDCFNKPIHEDTVLATRKQIESRNPLAFAPKVIRSIDSAPEIGDDSSTTPASARHKRGCNCKKSNCLKKYCECYQGGVGCSVNCRCEGCKNAFGRKDGSALMRMAAGPEEEETETTDRKVVEKSSQKDIIQNDEPRAPDSNCPATPLRLCRLSVQMPFPSKSKPPLSSLLATGSSSVFLTDQRIEKLNFLRPQPKLGKHFRTTPEEDEMPEILQGDCSPESGVKTSSPNSKRVTPPQRDSRSPPSLRTSRKLILQSIPSFPSLTQP